jgi:hypothetical protein
MVQVNALHGLRLYNPHCASVFSRSGIAPWNGRMLGSQVSEHAKNVLVRLPAFGCRSYYQGRCLYEEQLNPGLNQDYRCVVQLGWEAAYDDFLNRADNFGLDETELMRLWSARFERMVSEGVACPQYVPTTAEALPECRHLFVDICLLRLPMCAGHCINYRLRAKA